jgi:acetyl-CoA C-acetyltransferase
MNDAVIVSAVRTPTGKFLGGLKTLSATDLGALVVREAVRRAGIDPGSVDECIMGNVLSSGLGQAPARQAALRGGLGEHVAALTINKVCGSGLKAVMLAAQGIAVGDIEIAVAGGMESMSNAPYLLPGARDGFRMGNQSLLDSMLTDGLWCTFEQCHMGTAGEVVADRYSIGRDEQDAYAFESHRRATEATGAGRFTAEILPVVVPHRSAGSGRDRPAGGDVSRVVERDESIRPDTTIETLSALRPVFRTGGTVTAGNAPPVNDASSALVVMSVARAAQLGVTPMARIVGQATSGLAPKNLLLTPVDAVRRLSQKIGWPLDRVDLFELNEAFSVQAIAVLRDLGVDPQKVNVNGGAVALGHAIGASGARILTTLLYALEQRKLKRGIATLCLGGGNGVALAVERL